MPNAIFVTFHLYKSEFVIVVVMVVVVVVEEEEYGAIKTEVTLKRNGFLAAA